MPRPVGVEPVLRRELGDRPFRYHEVCDSTNDEARAWAGSGAPHGAVVVANAQRAGRGRHGRSWIAEPGAALLCSVILRPELDLARWSILPLLAGVAVAEAIETRTGVRASLKWPNDVVVGQAKLGGVLCEAEPPAWIVCGIGVNISSAPADVGATSLAACGAKRLDRGDLLAAVLERMSVLLAESEAALAAWRGLSSTIGARVAVEQADGATIRGIARGIDDAGALLLEDDDGVEHRIAAGDVQHLR